MGKMKSMLIRSLIVTMLVSIVGIQANVSEITAAEELYTKFSSLDSIVESTTTGTDKTISLTGVGSGVQFTAQEVGEYGAVSFTVPSTGIYTITFETFNHTRGAQGGTVAIDSLDNVLADVSFYAASTERKTFDVPLGTMELTQGEHRLYLNLTDARTYNNMYASGIKLTSKGIDLSISNNDLNVGETAQLEWSMNDGSIVDQNAAVVTYTSETPDVAVVNTSGEVTGVAEGIAVIAASVTIDGLNYQSSINVVIGDSANMISENYNHVVTGEIPDNLDAESAEVIEFPSAEDKSLSINTTTDESTNKVYYHFPTHVTGQMTVSYDVYAAAPDEGYFYIYPGHFYDENGSRPVRFYMDSNRDFWAQDGGSKATIDKFASNTWYNIKIVIDVEKQKWDLYIDHKLVGLGYDFRNQAAALTKIEFASFRSSKAYIDNVKIDLGGEVIPDHHGAVYGEQITGNPIGGGAGYSNTNTITDAAYVVKDLNELITALQNAEAGDVVFIPGDKQIDLTSLAGNSILIPEGVTLASDRGLNGSLGALLFTNYLSGEAADSKFDNNEIEIPGVLKAAGSNVRITGLRLQGQDGERHYDEVKATGANTYWIPLSRGIYSEYDIEIDNNEIYNFTYVGVSISDGNAYVHHNYIHDTMLQGLGYGISMNGGAAQEDPNLLAEANIFNNFRHAIAASGTPREKYEARYNIVKDGYSHAFDMHNYKENDAAWGENDGAYIAGNRVDIHHNTFTDTVLGHHIITIRGIPVYGAHIYNNWFHLPEEEGYYALRQYNTYGSHFVGANAYGIGGDKVIREGWLSPNEPNFIIKNIQHADMGGNTISELTPNGYVQTSLDITNFNWRSDHAALIVLLKNSGGYVENISTVHKEVRGRTTFGDGVGETLNTSFKLPKNVDGHTMEVLVWNSINGMKPANPSGGSNAVISNTNAELDNNIVTLSGQISYAGAQVTVKVLNPYGGLDYVGQTASISDGSFTFEYVLDASISGEYTFMVGGDGVDQPVEDSFVYIQAPEVVSPSDEWSTNKNVLEIVVKAPENTSIKVLNGSQEIGSGTGKGEEELIILLDALIEGQYDLSIVAVDAQGNSSMISSVPKITMDTTAPSAPTIMLQKPLTSSNPSPDIEVKAELGSSIKVMEHGKVFGTGIGQGDVPVMITLDPLSVGTHNMEVYATDAASNTSESSEMPQININKGN
jgi:hypothetical protein